jgi:hypothetical protein
MSDADAEGGEFHAFAGTLRYLRCLLLGYFLVSIRPGLPLLHRANEGNEEFCCAPGSGGEED